MGTMVPIDAALVRELLKAQLPSWTELPILPIASTGTDNVIFRVGSSLVARFPKVSWAVGQPEREHRWLPFLATQLSLVTPSPLALGKPGSGYPWHWSIHSWTEGESGTRDSLNNADAAERLAKFVFAMRAIDPSEGPASGPENSYRGVPLIQRDASVRRALKQLRDEPAIGAAKAIWDDAMGAPQSSSGPAWLHGDLQPSNLIIRNGQLVAVIDFGLMGVGDPACDLMPAWTCFTSASRRTFLSSIGANEQDIRRGRGWALSTALVALAHYRSSDPVMTEVSRSTLLEVSSDLSLG
jgi:aminoglycoside phosphotransferase (APT) family kinase protein